MTKPKQMGRPKFPPGQARTEALPRTRVTPAEMAAVEQMRAKLGMSISEFMRYMVELVTT